VPNLAYAKFIVPLILITMPAAQNAVVSGAATEVGKASGTFNKIKAG
jgi:hypothetical protein